MESPQSIPHALTLKAAHDPAGREETLDLGEDHLGVGFGHLVQDVGVLHQVERLGLEGRLLAVVLVELHVLQSAGLLPLTAEPGRAKYGS